jgi:peptide/nickel transport system ATP-binding protein
LSIEDFSVEYLANEGRVEAVDRLNLELHRGEILGLAGESGSGKSTAMMGALRLLPPPAVITSGRVLFEGRDLLSLPEEELSRLRWKEISVVFQSAMNALNPVLSVAEQITDVILRHELTSVRKARERARELLELVGISPSHLQSYPHQLSGGMRQRVVIAIALALRPKVLFMDEPTTALDVIVQREILEQISQLKRELGFAILFITHDLSLMLELCDTVGILYAGRLVELAPAEVLLSKPAHPYTRGLLNSFPELRGGAGRMTGIAGAPPNMLAPPSGCRFHPRCPEAIAECSERVPPLRPLSETQMAACHLAGRQGAQADTPPPEFDGSGPGEADRPTVPDPFPSVPSDSRKEGS